MLVTQISQRNGNLPPLLSQDVQNTRDSSQHCVIRCFVTTTPVRYTDWWWWPLLTSPTGWGRGGDWWQDSKGRKGLLGSIKLSLLQRESPHHQEVFTGGKFLHLYDRLQGHDSNQQVILLQQLWFKELTLFYSQGFKLPTIQLCINTLNQNQHKTTFDCLNICAQNIWELLQISANEESNEVER